MGLWRASGFGISVAEIGTSGLSEERSKLDSVVYGREKEGKKRKSRPTYLFAGLVVVGVLEL